MLADSLHNVALSALVTLAGTLPSQIPVGGDAPDVAFTDVLAMPGVQRLADLRGAALLVEFWATWCGPCKAQIPHLRQMHEKFAPKGLVVVAISDEPLAKVQPFAEQNGMTYPVAIAKSAMRDWGVSAIPQAFLIAPDGKIAWSGHPGTLREDTIEPLLATAVSPLQKLTEQLAPVQDLLDLDQRGRALAMLDTLTKDGKLAEPTAARATKVERMLRAQLDRLSARATDSKDHFTRALVLHEIAHDWTGQPIAATAREQLAALAETAKTDVAAAEHTLQAERHTARKEFAAATSAWRKVIDSGSTAGRKRAEAALADLRARAAPEDR